MGKNSIYYIRYARTRIWEGYRKVAPKQCLFGLYRVFSLMEYIYIGGKKKAQIWSPKQFFN